ncbi:MAG: twin-arginine translocase TatA/TatE family subunit [Thermaceae bacterium]|nr:twin-arginine translocase TatA/TatE family subunit [Thermaceae bacterium]
MNLGMPEILIILLVALLLFGPKKLPELGRGLGQSIREFRKGAQNIREEFEQATSLNEPPKPAPVAKAEEPKA